MPGFYREAVNTDAFPHLTDPARFGGDPSDAFTAIAPSLPGFGLSLGLKTRGTVNLSGRVSRMQATGSGHWGLLPTHTADFGPDLESLGPGSSMLGGSDVIAAEVEEVIDLVMG